MLSFSLHSPLSRVETNLMSFFTQRKKKNQNISKVVEEYLTVSRLFEVFVLPAKPRKNFQKHTIKVDYFASILVFPISSFWNVVLTLSYGCRLRVDNRVDVFVIYRWTFFRATINHVILGHYTRTRRTRISLTLRTFISTFNSMALTAKTCQ